jgi:hypothetical protein
LSNPREGVAEASSRLRNKGSEKSKGERMKGEKRNEASKRVSEKLEKAEEEIRKMRAERSEANRQLLEIARTNRARRLANESAKPTLETERATAEIQRIREAIDRGCDFLSSDQEAQIREAASGIIHEAPEAIIYI